MTAAKAEGWKPKRTKAPSRATPAAPTTPDWYSARLLIERTVEGSRPVKPLFEESVIVFQASDHREASRKAKQLGRKASHHFKNVYGETVRWTFREVLEVQEIMSDKGLVDGTEVYFRWWDKPSQRTLRMIRRTHEEPWWT